MLMLSDEDGRAVDILLDSKSTANVFGAATGDGGGGAAAAPPQLQQRLLRLQQLLELLQTMPAMEPPAHLLKKIVAQAEANRPARSSRPEVVFPGEAIPAVDARPSA